MATNIDPDRQLAARHSGPPWALAERLLLGLTIAAGLGGGVAVAAALIRRGLGHG